MWKERGIYIEHRRRHLNQETKSGLLHFFTITVSELVAFVVVIVIVLALVLVADDNGDKFDVYLHLGNRVEYRNILSNIGTFCTILYKVCQKVLSNV